MIGASPPRPKCEISTTADAKIEATPASIAFPPTRASGAGIGHKRPPGGHDAVVRADFTANRLERLLRRNVNAQRGDDRHNPRTRPQPAFRTPHSASRIPHLATRISQLHPTGILAHRKTPNAAANAGARCARTVLRNDAVVFGNGSGAAHCVGAGSGGIGDGVADHRRAGGVRRRNADQRRAQPCGCFQRPTAVRRRLCRRRRGERGDRLVVRWVDHHCAAPADRGGARVRVSAGDENRRRLVSRAAGQRARRRGRCVDPRLGVSAPFVVECRRPVVADADAELLDARRHWRCHRPSLRQGRPARCGIGAVRSARAWRRRA